MALIEIYHVTASYYDVSPSHDAVANPIIEGEFVTLDANGFVTQTAVNTTTMGLAGDTLATDSGYTPYAADIVISGSGATRSTSSRVSDFFDETTGSSKMTVYHGGGEFYTDRYATGQTWTPGAIAFCTAAGLVTTTDAGSDRPIGRVVEGPSAYPSGVPGTDVEGSISLGSYVRFVLTL